MKKYILLCLVALVGFSVSDVQKELVTLDWSGVSEPFIVGDDMTVLFENADFPDSTTEIPVYTRLYNLSSANKNLKFVLENLEFEEITKKIGENIAEKIEDNVKITTNILSSAKSRKAELKIIPVKYEDGKLFRLKSFEIRSYQVAKEKSAVAEHDWNESSVLGSGTWVKISTSGKGIYKISYSKLQEWGFSNPSEVSVFGSGGTLLSENPGEIAYDDLPQNAVWHAQSDGADCLFFYAPGTIEWSSNGAGSFIHKNNDYVTKGYYYLTESGTSQKNVELLPEVERAATHQTSTFNEFALFESNITNVLTSGKQWFGESFSYATSKDFTFTVENADESAEGNVLINAIARSYASSSMGIATSSGSLGSISFSSVSTTDTYGLYADETKKRLSFTPTSGDLELTLTYNGSNSSAKAWLDYLELNYRRQLILGDEPLFFRDSETVGPGNVVEFTLSNASSETRIFDVSDVNNVTEMQGELSDDQLSFKYEADEINEFVAFDADADYEEPEFVSDVANQNIHGLSTPEFIIIAHSNFMSAAEDLAEFHREYDEMDVEVLNAEYVYNEFSSGIKSATGIRNCIKMFYDRGSTLKYVLLMGDGSYDNLGVSSESNNFIPTYQSDNSLTPTSSFVTDDYFVMLDDDESVSSGAIDLGVGRIPATTAYEAQLVVDKVQNYYSPEALGDWRNIVSFIGDDEDSGLHMKQSEQLADSLNKNYCEFETKKIYFDAYTEEVTSSGESYPDVNEAINESVEDGVLILNYIGHANELFLAAEHVLDVSDISSWTNSNKLPIFVTATCEFSRFDADDTSAGEYVLLNANGGGIGLFSTTRVVYASSNFVLSKSFYNYIFDYDSNGEHYRMGDVMRLAKTNIGTSINKRNFSLLADPALKLSYPKYKIKTTSVNQEDASGDAQTIGALQKITVSGYVSDVFENKIDDFEGELIPTVYDKEVEMETLGNNGNTTVRFTVRENVIYKGLASVTNGEFSFSFVVPKDISYSVGEGKISYYAQDGEEDAHGAFTNFNIGGTSSEITDNEGPEIQLFMDSEDFKSGDKTGKNPVLLANLYDENGINTVGTGIGHDITVVIDDDNSDVTVLNSYYQANTDDYTSGSLSYQLSDLSVGVHTLKLKAWDVANNSSEVEISFEVTDELNIIEISNYPNPVSDYTYFVFEHNQSGEEFDVIFDIYNQQGSSVDRFQTTVSSNGTSSIPVRWDLEESNISLTSGVYLYRAIVQNADGLISSKTGKMVVVQ